jgi:3-deoxy-manno-octulosonate cytidylyltransferase (CMP-KDO synthetase)
MSKNKVVAIIPSRLESSRLPRKALADICGLPMVVHVFKRCQYAKSLDKVFVATDNEEIFDIVEKYGGEALMTSSHHENGTERIAEAAKDINADIIVNVQGDEALVNPIHIDSAVNSLIEDENINISILINKFSKKNSTGDIKAVIDENNNIMYLSRSDIPSNARSKNNSFYKAYHIVPFRKYFLMEYSKWQKGSLEKIESNEYLRILEKGYKIRAVKVDSEAISVDTVEDLHKVRELMKADNLFPEYI